MHAPTTFLRLALLLLALIACQPTSPEVAVEAKKKSSKSDPRDIPALKGEIARLEREIATGSRPDPYAAVGIINAHEHLRLARNIDNYLAAARRAGVSATVIVASPPYTLDGEGEKGEPFMSDNFEDEVLAAATAHPGEIIPFCTLDPKDPDKLERLKRHVEMGAKGLKLYTGHSNFIEGPLDDPGMEPVLDYLEETGLPVLWHINLEKFYEDFARILARHPKLNVEVAHYGVTFFHAENQGFKNLISLLETYPNLLVDTSLGTREILINGMAMIEPNRALFQDLFRRFPKQILWATDSVVTGNIEKTPGWYNKVIWATRDHLEQDLFRTDLAAAFSKYYQKNRDGDGVYRGLAIPEEILRQVYHDNAMRWLRLKESPVPPRDGELGELPGD